MWWNISETVRDKDLGTKDHQLEMDHRESNGHVTDDVMHVTLKGQGRDPNTLEANISKTAGDRGFVPKDRQ